MANFQDHDDLDFKYALGGDTLLGPNQEDEPMEGDTDSDCRILEEEDEDQPQSPAGPPPAEQEEQGLFVCADKDIFEQDDPPPVPASQSSLYGASQLVGFVNVPTKEDLGVSPRYPRLEAAL